MSYLKMRKVCFLAFLSVMLVQPRVSGMTGADGGKELVEASFAKPNEMEPLPETNGAWSDKILTKPNRSGQYLRRCAYCFENDENIPTDWQDALRKTGLKAKFDEEKETEASDELRAKVNTVWDIVTELKTDTPKHKNAVVACIGLLAYVTQVGVPTPLSPAAREIRNQLRLKEYQIDDPQIHGLVKEMFAMWRA